MVLKTCGNTTPLAVLRELGGIRGVRYSHREFLRVKDQPREYQEFDREMAEIDKAFTGEGRVDHQEGEGEAEGVKWWKYEVWQGKVDFLEFREINMTELRGGYEWISKLYPGDLQVVEHYFHPCGYSMNGHCGGGYLTIHITPESGFSYASLEFGNGLINEELEEKVIKMCGSKESLEGLGWKGSKV